MDLAQEVVAELSVSRSVGVNEVHLLVKDSRWFISDVGEVFSYPPTLPHACLEVGDLFRLRDMGAVTLYLGGHSEAGGNLVTTEGQSISPGDYFKVGSAICQLLSSESCTVSEKGVLLDASHFFGDDKDGEDEEIAVEGEVGCDPTLPYDIVEEAEKDGLDAKTLVECNSAVGSTLPYEPDELNEELQIEQAFHPIAEATLPYDLQVEDHSSSTHKPEPEMVSTDQFGGNLLELTQAYDAKEEPLLEGTQQYDLEDGKIVSITKSGLRPHLDVEQELTLAYEHEEEDIADDVSEAHASRREEEKIPYEEATQPYDNGFGERGDTVPDSSGIDQQTTIGGNQSNEESTQAYDEFGSLAQGHSSADSLVNALLVSYTQDDETKCKDFSPAGEGQFTKLTEDATQLYVCDTEDVPTQLYLHEQLHERDEVDSALATIEVVLPEEATQLYDIGDREESKDEVCSHLADKPEACEKVAEPDNGQEGTSESVVYEATQLYDITLSTAEVRDSQGEEEKRLDGSHISTLRDYEPTQFYDEFNGNDVVQYEPTQPCDAEDEEGAILPSAPVQEDGMVETELIVSHGECPKFVEVSEDKDETRSVEDTEMKIENEASNVQTTISVPEGKLEAEPVVSKGKRRGRPPKNQKLRNDDDTKVTSKEKAPKASKKRKSLDVVEDSQPAFSTSRLSSALTGGKAPKHKKGNSTKRESQETVSKTPQAKKRRKVIHEVPASNAPCVLFTGIVDPKREKMIIDLGGTVATSVDECTHLVTDKVHRTIKFLVAVCRGLHIVSYRWIDRCAKDKHFVDEAAYLVKDVATERKFSFSLSDSLKRARQHSVLEGRRVFVTSSVRPPPIECSQIINAAGGTVTSCPLQLDDTLVISCKEDSDEYKPLVALGFTIYQAELLLTAALCQRLELSSRKCLLVWPN